MSAPAAETSFPPDPLHIDWADDLAAQIIADFCGKGFTAARKAIAGRLRVVKTTCDEAVMARIRLAGQRETDAQFDRVVEQLEGWTVR